MNSGNSKLVSILVITGLYPPEIGGPATYSKLLEDELPKHGFQVKVLPFSEVRNLPKLVRHLVFTWKIIKQGKKVDIVYAQDPVSVGFPTWLASLFLKKGYLLRLGGDYAWEQSVQRFGVRDNLDTFASRWDYSAPVRTLKKIQTLVAMSAEMVIVPSEYLKSIIIKWGVPSHKIQVIHSTFDKPQLSYTKEVVRQKLGISGNVIVSVGRLVPWKGFMTLIEVMPELLKTDPELQLYIIGDGPESKNLANKISELNLQSHVFLTGRLKQEFLFEYIKAADAFVLNTEYEGLSHQVLEVMALGTPVVTTNIGGNREVVVDHKTGLLVPYNDRQALINAIENIITDKTMTKNLTEQAMYNLDQFSLDVSLQKIINVLQHHANS